MSWWNWESPLVRRELKAFSNPSLGRSAYFFPANNPIKPRLKENAVWRLDEEYNERASVPYVPLIMAWEWWWNNAVPNAQFIKNDFDSLSDVGAGNEKRAQSHNAHDSDSTEMKWRWNLIHPPWRAFFDFFQNPDFYDESLFR